MIPAQRSPSSFTVGDPRAREDGLGWVARAVFPDPGLRLRLGDDKTAAARYAVIPSLDRARFLLPLASARVTAASVLAYNALRPPRVRLSRAVIGLLARAGALAAVRAPVLSVHGGPLLWEHLAGLLGVDRLYAAIGIRPPDPHHKPTLQLFDDAGQPRGYAKIGWNDGTRAMVRAEAATLAELPPPGGDLPAAPRLMLHTRWQDREIAIIEPMPRSVRRIRRPDEPRLAAMLAVARRGGPPTAPQTFADSPFLATWRRRAEGARATAAPFGLAAPADASRQAAAPPGLTAPADASRQAAAPPGLTAPADASRPLATPISATTPAAAVPPPPVTPLSATTPAALPCATAPAGSCLPAAPPSNVAAASPPATASAASAPQGARDDPPSITVAAAIDALEARAGALTLEFGDWHGDWVPWNMARHRGGLLIWDWENRAPDVPVGFDLAHQAFQTALSTCGKPAAQCAEAVDEALRAHGPALGLDPSRQRFIADAYLIELWLRTYELSHGGAGWNPKLHPALLHVLAARLEPTQKPS